jgi:hypothetical protein
MFPMPTGSSLFVETFFEIKETYYATNVWFLKVYGYFKKRPAAIHNEALTTLQFLITKKALVSVLPVRLSPIELAPYARMISFARRWE